MILKYWLVYKNATLGGNIGRARVCWQSGWDCKTLHKKTKVTERDGGKKKVKWKRKKGRGEGGGGGGGCSGSGSLG